MKILQAKLKDEVSTAVDLDVLCDFKEDWLTSSAIVENAKRLLVNRLKTAYHEKIATLCVDDIVFKITAPSTK